MCRKPGCLAHVRNSSANIEFSHLQRFTWDSKSFIIFFPQSHQVVGIRRFIDEICTEVVHTFLPVYTWQKIVGNFFLFGVCVCVRAKCLGENLGNRHTSTQSTIHITHHVHEGEKGSNKRLMIKYFFSLCCTGYGFSLWVCGLLHCVCISFYVNLARFCINMYAGLE